MSPTFNFGSWRLIVSSILILFCFSSYPAISAEQSDTLSSIVVKKKYASVGRVSGKVTASFNSIEKVRVLQEYDAVYVGDLIKADASSDATLKTEDAGIIAIRPNTEFLAETFSAEGNDQDNFSVHLIKGSLRIISGWISHTNRNGIKLTTSTATIGVRGTDHEPYVVSAEMAYGTQNKEGTYDKVNRGGTYLKVGDVGVDIDSGKVGFARETNQNSSGRALMTILLPVLLDKVPSFYVPGKFDADLDQYSEAADRISQAKLDYKLNKPAMPVVSDCMPEKIATTWLSHLDSGIAQNDAQQIIALFSPNVAIRATVHDKDGKASSVDLGREEFVQSTRRSMKELKGYKQHRTSVEAKLLWPSSSSSCDHISLHSGVIEEGFQSGKPYRFESIEDYVLELHEGNWVSSKAETTQR